MQFRPEPLKDGRMLVDEVETESLCTRHWLAGISSSSPYQAYVESLFDLDPRLRSRDPKAVAQKILWRDYGRVATLEMSDHGTFGPTTMFHDAESLRAHLDKGEDENPGRQQRRSEGDGKTATEGTPGRRTVYLLEGMGPGFAGVLGEYLCVPPAAFLDHERIIVMNTAAQGESDGMLLPSMTTPVAAASPLSPSPTNVPAWLTSLSSPWSSHVTMKYFEPLQLDHAPDNFLYVCADTGRHIGVSRSEDRFIDVGVVRRKCTMWTRSRPGDGWDCLIICDPPVRRVRSGVGYHTVTDMRTEPYQGGYVDFVPQWAQSNLPGGSPLPDGFLSHTHAASLVVRGAYASMPTAAVIATPHLVVAPFVRKIVAAHYLKLAGHIRAMLSKAQRALSRKHDLASLPMQKVEELWSDTQASERRVGEYAEDLEAIMLQIGIPLEKPDPTRLPTSGSAAAGEEEAWPSHQRDKARSSTCSTAGPKAAILSQSPSSTTLVEDFARGQQHSHRAAERGRFGSGREENSDDGSAEEQKRLYRAALRCWIDPILDYQFLLLRFQELRHRTECLNSAVTGLASITGNRQAYHEQQLALETARRSIREAKSAKAITLLGLIFLPLAYTSSLFSMTEPYGPGGDQFWQYFATSAPLIIVVLLAYWVLDAGYTDDVDRTSWSWVVFRATAKRAWRARDRRQRAK